MSSVKTFEIAARRKGRKKPIPFKLNESDKETYHIDPNRSMDSMALLYAEFLSGDEKDGIGWVNTTIEMMKIVFTEETFERLKKRILSGELRFEDLDEVYQWATEELTGRPTKSQSD